MQAIRPPHDEQTPKDFLVFKQHHFPGNHGFAPGHPVLDPERIAERVARAGCKGHESLVVAIAAHATLASPLGDADVDWIASAAARVGDEDLLIEAAGVVFAFNFINRIADARRVRLEYRFLRELKPIRGWVERRFASMIGLLYDLSYQHQPRHSSAELLDRIGVLFDRLGAPSVPEVFHWLGRSPAVLEGVLELIEANIMHSGLRPDLWKEAAAIAVASRAMPGSGLSRAVDRWLPRDSSSDPKALRSWAAPPGAVSDSGLVSACRRYAWQVANAAYTITDDQIRKISALGLPDAEILDLALATALFSALAIIESIGAAAAPAPMAVGQALSSTGLPVVA